MSTSKADTNVRLLTVLSPKALDSADIPIPLITIFCSDSHVCHPPEPTLPRTQATTQYYFRTSSLPILAGSMPYLSRSPCMTVNSTELMSSLR